MQRVFFGHSENGLAGNGVSEPLVDHIRFVSERAKLFGDSFGVGEQAWDTGLLHDLGKYSEQFQRRLCDSREKGRDHWSIGAACAAKIGLALGIIPALAIEGHHVGLGSILDAESFHKKIGNAFRDYQDKFTTIEVQSVLNAFKADGFSLPTFQSGLLLRHDWVGDMLDTRMLFSTLVDADFLETEAHFEGDKTFPRRPRPNGKNLDPEQAIQAFERHLSAIPRDERENPFILLREALTSRCRVAGLENQQGIFTLTAPTGAGKTLAMLGFALAHAQRHELRRIVLVMPFLNIIDQTARIYREIFPSDKFGEDFVLECHSLADEAIERIERSQTGELTEDDISPLRRRRRLLSENWDAAIVLTTHIQLLESLFAHKPSRCRKLHRLAGSVILFDEVQTLPPKLVVPTLGALNRLAGAGSRYRTTVVFATATQPAFDALSNRVGSLVDKRLFKESRPTWRPIEIVENSSEMFEVAAGRVQMDWRQRNPIDFSSLATELQHHRQVLCIVNLKRHATQLAGDLQKQTGNVFHLSTNMCTAHRIDVLDKVRKHLDIEKPVRLIATQCVEAGVDIDFPYVYRALAPLEAIAQAAGRCNRSARRENGHVVVFKPHDVGDDGRERRLYPPGYNAAVDATELFLNNICHDLGTDHLWPEIINSPERLRAYYRLFYALNGRDKAEQTDERELVGAIRAGSFPDVAKEYRLIEQNVINVLVPYNKVVYDSLISEAERDDMTPRDVRAWNRKAHPHAVSVYRPTNPQAELWNQLIALPLGLEDDDVVTSTHEWWRLAEEDSYDLAIGLKLMESQWVV